MPGTCSVTDCTRAHSAHGYCAMHYKRKTRTGTTDGRTLVQGALAWIWARSATAVPIPGFKTVAQAEENAGALAHGPLPSDTMREIDLLLGRAA